MKIRRNEGIIQCKLFSKFGKADIRSRIVSICQTYSKIAKWFFELRKKSSTIEDLSMIDGGETLNAVSFPAVQPKKAINV